MRATRATAAAAAAAAAEISEDVNGSNPALPTTPLRERPPLGEITTNIQLEPNEKVILADLEKLVKVMAKLHSRIGRFGYNGGRVRGNVMEKSGPSTGD